MPIRPGLVALRPRAQQFHASVKTTDQLLSIPLPGAIGFTTQWQNAGTIVGNTWEGTLEAEVLQRGTTTWKIGLIADRFFATDACCANGSPASRRRGW